MSGKGISLDSFLIENPIINSPLVRSIDMKELVSASDEDFAQYYLLLMEEYREKDGWWSCENKTPKCSECQDVILNPASLRRYGGMSYHPRCFSDVYTKERDSYDDIFRKYFDRVASLNFENS